MDVYMDGPRPEDYDRRYLQTDEESDADIDNN